MSSLGLIMGSKLGTNNVISTTPQYITDGSGSMSKKVNSSGVIVLREGYTMPTAGSIYTLSVNGRSVSYSPVAGNTITTILNKFVTFLDNETWPVTVVRSTNKLFITARMAGLIFDSAFFTNDPAVDYQLVDMIITPNKSGNVWLLDFGTLNYDLGDVISVTVDGELASYTVPASETSPRQVIENFAATVTPTGFSLYANYNVELPILTIVSNSLLPTSTISVTVTN